MACGVPVGTSYSSNYIDTTPSHTQQTATASGADSVTALGTNVPQIAAWRARPVSYAALPAARVLDTRAGATTVDGQYAAMGTLASQATVNLALSDRGGVPASSIGAIVMSVTALNSAAPGYLTFWPTGASRPLAGNINPNPGLTISSLVVTKVGTNSQVSIFNGATGATDLVINVQGWLPPESGYNAITPARFLDTRATGATFDGQSQAGGALAALGTRNVIIANRGLIPANATAAIIKITGVMPGAEGFVTLWAAGQAQPATGNVNLNQGLVMSNLAIVPIGSAGQISIYNGSAAPTDLTADVQGWFSPTSSFTAITPSRLLDTRSTGPALAAGATMNLTVTNRAGIPVSPGAVVLKLTAVSPSAAGFLTMWPTGDAQPPTGNLNLNPGRTMSNLVFVKPGSNQVSIYNGSAAAVNVVVDAQGWFATP